MTHCPSCQEPVEQDAMFCGSCGTPLAAARSDATETIRQPSATPQPGPSHPGAQGHPGQTYPPAAGATQAYPPAVSYAPAPAPVAYAGPPAGGRSRAAVVTAIVLAAALVALAAFFGTRWWQNRSSSTQAQEEVVVTVTATPSDAATTSSPATSQPAAAPVPAQTTSYPDVAANGGKECLREGTGPYAAVGTGNPTTSCPFAVNVRTAYLQSGINGGTGTVVGYSQAAGGINISMTCTGTQPVVCTGGRAGIVYIYGGTLR